LQKTIIQNILDNDGNEFAGGGALVGTRVRKNRGTSRIYDDQPVLHDLPRYIALQHIDV